MESQESEPMASTARWAKLRLSAMIGTGMVMFVFISMHLANLALGLDETTGLPLVGVNP